MGLYPAGGRLPEGFRANSDGSYTFSRPAQPRPAAAPAASDDPYAMVGHQKIGRTHYLGRPRWQADLERERASLDMEYQRWMLEQMKSNPFGVSIRELIYGRGM